MLFHRVSAAGVTVKNVKFSSDACGSVRAPPRRRSMASVASSSRAQFPVTRPTEAPPAPPKTSASCSALDRYGMRNYPFLTQGGPLRHQISNARAMRSAAFGRGLCGSQLYNECVYTERDLFARAERNSCARLSESFNDVRRICC